MLFQNKKLNKLLIGAIVVGLAVPLLNVLLIYPNFYKQITSGIENTAIRLAIHMENELRMHEESWHALMDGREISPQGAALLKSYIDDFGLSKMKIFSTEGIAVYSTEKADIGKVNTNSYFLDHVVKGEIYSKVVKKETQSLEGQQYKEDIVEIYVPMMEATNFIGAFELYYNITGQISSLEKRIFNAAVLPFAVSAFLLFALYWGFLNLDKSLIEKQKAEAEVKALQGIIPICAHCKEIRDDKGSWNQMEVYIESHSDAQFSHGICDSCLEKHYGKEMADQVLGKKDSTT